MKRTPMKRTPFKRKPRIEGPTAEREPKPWAPGLKSLVRGTYATTTKAVAIPKHDYIRSESLMKAYRLIPCQNCGKDDGTVCGAHSNWAEHGKGRGIKADDNRCASLCFTCHGMLDQGSILGASERFALWSIAHIKTVAELLRRNLWPKGVPVPNTARTGQ